MRVNLINCYGCAIWSLKCILVYIFEASKVRTYFDVAMGSVSEQQIPAIRQRKVDCTLINLDGHPKHQEVTSQILCQKNFF